MKTNLNIQESKELYDILLKFPLKGIYYEGIYGCIDTRFEPESQIYLDAISKIIHRMCKGQSFEQAIFQSSRFEILEDYSQGFLNQQQLSDYLKDSYTDEEMANGKPLHDVYIR